MFVIGLMGEELEERNEKRWMVFFFVQLELGFQGAGERFYILGYALVKFGHWQKWIEKKKF